MNSIFFLMGLAVLSALYLYWGITRLTADNRQVFAAVPSTPLGSDRFQGINFTWYGLLTANSLVAAVLMFLILGASVDTSVSVSFSLIIVSLMILLPSARIVARIVEKKKHTFTVGGSVFLGILLSPVLIFLLNVMFGCHLGLMETLAGLALSYALGESLGRLACISFGCCYGKPLCKCHPFLRKLFEKHPIIYRGTTRKACYASNLAGEKLLPIQAVTAVIYAVTAVLGTGFFLAGRMGTALVLAVSVTQIWRVVSEMFRDDYRGEGRFSAYQIMGLIAVGFILLVVGLAPSASPVVPDILKGVAVLTNPWVILACQGLWLLVFLYMGRSTVTGSTIQVHVVIHHT